jgi:hypothetical protein
MKKEIRLIVLIVALIILSCGIALAQDATQERKEIAASAGTSKTMIVLDVLVVRPAVMVVATGSTIICVVTMPYAYYIGAGDEWYDIMIGGPWGYVGDRPLGDF